MRDDASVDEDQLTALRKWGEGLRQDGREEVRAAGRAIVLLCDEIERLEIALLHERVREERSFPPPPPSEHQLQARDVVSSLLQRLERFRLSVFRR
jgi:hypothetical protein